MPAQELEFRPARPSDADAVVALVESAYRGESSRAGWTTEADLLGGQRTDRAEVDALIADPDATLLLALASGALSGCVLIVPAPSATAHIGMFAVRPGLQGKGLGRALLAAAEGVGRARGAARAKLTVLEQRQELLGWYARRGYLLTGATEPFPYGNLRFGLPKRPDLRFAVMEKTLQAAPR